MTEDIRKALGLGVSANHDKTSSGEFLPTFPHHYDLDARRRWITAQEDSLMAKRDPAIGPLLTTLDGRDAGIHGASMLMELKLPALWKLWRLLRGGKAYK